MIEMIRKTVNDQKDSIMALVKRMYENPEIGFQEFETQKRLMRYRVK